MRTNLLNTFFTIRRGGERYEVGKYMVSDGSRKGEQYYVSGFFFHCTPESCWVWMDGRFKGDKFKTPLSLAKKERLAERPVLSRADAERFRAMAGFGKKPAYVMTSDGYIYLPRVLMFDTPWEIMGWAADSSIKWHHELHKRKPKREFFPDWIAEENGFDVGATT